ncbi:MAG: arsenate reductase family protein [Candidatus Krumholzibacteriia bacterium]
MTVYGYLKCSTCRNALKWLDGHGLSYTFIDITEQPPPKTLLRALAKQFGLKRLFNTSGGQYRELAIKDRLAALTEAEAIDLLAQNGRLCKRPIVTDGTRHSVGFKVDEFAGIWG